MPSSNSTWDKCLEVNCLLCHIMEAANLSIVERCPITYVHVIRIPSSSYIINSIAGCVANAVFSVAGTVLNTFVLFTLWRSTTLRKKVTYFLIMVLSSTNLGVGLTVHPLYLMYAVSEIRRNPNCLYKTAYQTTQLLFAGLSAMNLFTLNIERYLSIVHPIFHRNCVTIRSSVIFLTVVGLIPLSAVVSLIFDLNISLFIAVVAFIGCSGICFMNIRIFQVAKRVLMPKARIQINEEEQERNSVKHRENTAIFLRHLKMTKMCLLVVSCLFICYLPNGIVLVLWTEKSKTLDNKVQAAVWTTTLVSINSTINCLIFFWTRKELRKEWKKAMMIWNRTSHRDRPLRFNLKRR